MHDESIAYCSQQSQNMVVDRETILCVHVNTINSLYLSDRHLA